MESVDFSNIQKELEGRLNQDTELVTETDRPTLAVDSPMAVVSGNNFQVQVFIYLTCEACLSEYV